MQQPWYTQFFHGVALDFWRAAITPAQTTAEVDYTFTRSGVSETRSITQHVYTAAEISRLLVRAGLATPALYASLDLQPFELGSPQLFIIARKAGPA